MGTSKIEYGKGIQISIKADDKRAITIATEFLTQSLQLLKKVIEEADTPREQSVTIIEGKTIKFIKK